MKKDEKLLLTKEKLIHTTMMLMESCKDAEEVTSRAIASNAGVQVAMINYCFGSREALLFEAFQKNENHFMSDSRILEVLNSPQSPKEKLRALHYVVAEYLINAFNYTKAITSYVLLHRDLSKGLHSLPLVIAHYKGRKSEQECKLIAYELSSVMQLAIYRYEDLGEFTGFDLKDIKQLHQFIDIQIDLFLED